MTDDMGVVAALLLGALALLALFYIGRWLLLERRRPRANDKVAPRLVSSVLGFVTNFFDTLGVGSFAPTTAAFRLLGLVPDEKIPGTLNVGHALPTVTQALIFIAVVRVDPLTLVLMIAAAVVGAWLGAGIVAKLPRRAIQIGMGAALVVAATLYIMANLGWIPGGGEALKLSGGLLVLAIAVNVLLGALMTLGVGLYAPCLILVSLLGLNPIAAFPIMMGCCAFLMPVAGLRFVEADRYDLRAALGLALGGIPGVLVAAFIVKQLPMNWLRWMVAVVVLYTALSMLNAARRRPAASPEAA